MLAQTPPTFSNITSKTSDSSTAFNASCSLIWSDRQLFVKAQPEEESFELSRLADRDRLVECLKRSPVDCVKLDRDLGAEMLLWWADACGEAGKECYVTPSNERKTASILSIQFPAHLGSRLLSLLQRILHQATALIMTTILLPLLALQRPSLQWTRRWAVNTRGKILQVLTVDDHLSSQWTAMANRLVNVGRGVILLNEPMPELIETYRNF